MGTNDKESFPNERPGHLVQVQGFWKEVHSFATPPIAKAIAQARDEERLPILVLPIQVFGA